MVSNGHESSPLYTCSNSGSDGRLDIVPLGDVVVVICSYVVRFEEASHVSVKFGE